MVVLLVIAACGWLTIAVFGLALCAMAKRGDETDASPAYDPREPRPERATAVHPRLPFAA